MRNLVFLSLVFILSISAKAQIEMNSSGYVGIGASPISGYKLNTTTLKTSFTRFDNGVYSGILVESCSNFAKQIVPTSNNTCYLGSSSKAFAHIYTYGLTNYSDKRGKENIKEIAGALYVILNLRGVTYDLKHEIIFTDSLDSKIRDKEYKEKRIKESKDKIGFIAQEVKEVLPNAVSYDDSADVYGVNYIEIIPVLVEAIKEQQEMINELKSKNDKKNQKSAEIEIENGNVLFQNAPNPFTESTTIKYNIAENVKNAMLNIYNMNGTQLKSIDIHQTGSSSVTINGNEFGAGMYMYALITDGQIVDTKNMVLTD